MGTIEIRCVLNDDQNAVVVWTMHPWERDAKLAKKALKKSQQSYGLLIEIACTRSAEELLGARKAYHSLFDHSLEEDVAHLINGSERKVISSTSIIILCMGKRARYIY